MSTGSSEASTSPARGTRAVLLVGGAGTRLRPLTFSIPKPLLPVGDRPILQIIIEQLRAADVTDIILATGYHAELIRAFCGTGSQFGVRISYVREDKPLGTAGPLSLVRDRFVGEESFLLMNGDILTQLDFKAFLATSRTNGCEMTVGYSTHVYRSPFGVLTVKDGLVQAIVEKPTQEYPISAGVYCIKSTALPLVPDGQFFTVPDLMERLWAAGKKVGAYHIREAWVGLENVESFQEAMRELGNAPIGDATFPAERNRS